MMIHPAMSLELGIATSDDVERLLPLVLAYHEFEGVRLDAQARELCRAGSEAGCLSWPTFILGGDA